MFFTPFIKTSVSAVRAPRLFPSVVEAFPVHVRDALAVRVTACAVRAHCLVTPVSEHTTVRLASGLPRAAGVRRSAFDLLRRASRMVARAALKVACAGNPLTPGGYTIVGITVVVVALVAAMSASSSGVEPEHPLWLINLLS